MPRPHRELVHPPDDPEEDLVASGWPVGARLRVLSRDSETDALTAVVRLPAGYRRPAGTLSARSELLVLSGALRAGGEVREFLYHDFRPAGATHPPWIVQESAELLLMCHGPLDFRPGPGDDSGAGVIERDAERELWQLPPFPGAAPGAYVKVLRHDAASGEALFLCAGVPAWDYPFLEYHDCVEECFMVRGEIWLGNAGHMTTGSYFWRPPYVTHGPFYSRDGCLFTVYIDAPLVNHFVDDPLRTPEQNRAEAEARQGDPDHLAVPTTS